MCAYWHHNGGWGVSGITRTKKRNYQGLEIKEHINAVLFPSFITSKNDGNRTEIKEHNNAVLLPSFIIYQKRRKYNGLWNFWWENEIFKIFGARVHYIPSKFRRFCPKQILYKIHPNPFHFISHLTQTLNLPPLSHFISFFMSFIYYYQY